MRLSDHEQRELDARYSDRRTEPKEPQRLEFPCHCGEIVGWPDCVDHACPWTAHEPGEPFCLECGRYRKCPCEGGPVL